MTQDPTYANVSIIQRATSDDHHGGKTACPRSTWLVLAAFTLLLGIAIPLGVHYTKQKLEALEIELSDITEKLEMLQLCHDNATAMARALEDTLTKIKSNLAGQITRNANLTKEITVLRNQLQDLQDEAVSNCAAGWEYFSGKCYYFSTDIKNWAESRDACVTMGGHLVIIETQEEQDFLSRQNPTLPNRYWIGLTDSAKEGEWRWVDNSLLNDNAKYWWGHEPDDWKGTAARPLPEGEDCAEMFVNGVRLSWYDASCKDSSKRICESKAK